MTIYHNVPLSYLMQWLIPTVDLLRSAGKWPLNMSLGNTLIRLIELEDSSSVGSTIPWAGILDRIKGRDELNRSIHCALLQSFNFPYSDGL